MKIFDYPKVGKYRKVVHNLIMLLAAGLIGHSDLYVAIGVFIAVRFLYWVLTVISVQLGNKQ